uniref:C-type lectin domain-containing protein n=1 Tax=Oncorhynchus kisutch TaxID=8019 RepID=A0A8C7N7U1_ONCKI
MGGKWFECLIFISSKRGRQENGRGQAESKPDLGGSENQSTSYNNLTKERDQLQKEKENLNKKIKGRRCPEGWREFEFSCYYITNENKTWMQSTEECQEYLSMDYTKQKNNVWIGLTDSVTEWTWKWVDGTPLTTANWGKRAAQRQGWWNDEKCCNKQNWICGEIG